eukprot:6213762-Pleurochrysis_carterae.AAC.5
MLHRKPAAWRHERAVFFSAEERLVDDRHRLTVARLRLEDHLRREGVRLEDDAGRRRERGAEKYDIDADQPTCHGRVARALERGISAHHPAECNRRTRHARECRVRRDPRRVEQHVLPSFEARPHVLVAGDECVGAAAELLVFTKRPPEATHPVGAAAHHEDQALQEEDRAPVVRDGNLSVKDVLHAGDRAQRLVGRDTDDAVVRDESAPHPYCSHAALPLGGLGWHKVQSAARQVARRASRWRQRRCFRVQARRRLRRRDASVIWRAAPCWPHDAVERGRRVGAPACCTRPVAWLVACASTARRPRAAPPTPRAAVPRVLRHIAGRRCSHCLNQFAQQVEQWARARPLYTRAARMPGHQEHSLPNLRRAVHKLVKELREVEGQHDDRQPQHCCRERQYHTVGDGVSDRRLDLAVPLRKGYVRRRLHWSRGQIQRRHNFARRHRAQLLPRRSLFRNAARRTTLPRHRPAWHDACAWESKELEQPAARRGVPAVDVSELRHLGRDCIHAALHLVQGVKPASHAATGASALGPRGSPARRLAIPASPPCNPTHGSAGARAARPLRSGMCAATPYARSGSAAGLPTLPRSPVGTPEG